MAEVVEHDEAQSRYELRVDGDVVSVVGYERRDDVVVLLHTATEPEHRHRGYAGRLVAQVLADLERQGVRTLVHCPFVRWYRSQTAGA